MATQTLTEAIALTEKKMDMTLDDIIKMSKKPISKGKRPPRASNKNQGFLKGRASQGSSQIQHVMDSRSSIRQGILAQRRSNFQVNQFPIATKAARRAAAFHQRNRAVNWSKPRVGVALIQRNGGQSTFAVQNESMNMPKPKTLDARFANMKEQRMRVMISQQHQQHQQHQHQHQQYQMVRSSIIHSAAQRSRAQQQQQQQQQRSRISVPSGGAGRQFSNFTR